MIHLNEKLNILITPKSRDKFKTQKTFGELKEGDIIYTYSRYNQTKGVYKYVVTKVKNAYRNYEFATVIGGKFTVPSDVIEIHYKSESYSSCQALPANSSLAISESSNVWSTDETMFLNALQYYDIDSWNTI